MWGFLRVYEKRDAQKRKKSAKREAVVVSPLSKRHADNERRGGKEPPTKSDPPDGIIPQAVVWGAGE
jgi:hypothetical protein